MLHSLARNHGLVDGNKRIALAATIAFLGMNDIRLTLTNDEAYDLVIDVATGTLDDVPSIASVLESHSEPRGSSPARERLITLRPTLTRSAAGVPAPQICSRRATSIPLALIKHLLTAGRRSGRCVRTRVRTSAETPSAPGSVAGVTGSSSTAGNRSGSRASPGGRPGAPFPRVRGPLDRGIADRLGRSPATVKAYFYDPTGEKARAVKARYVACAAAAARTRSRATARRRLRVLQALSSRCDQAEVDAGAGDLGDAGVARALRPPAIVLDWSRPTPADAATRHCGASLAGTGRRPAW